ncbi:hypothetical protein EB796_012405 [Bugula neritina]|uniref:Uncharacterized protein n=1 Tax=Bugula neritina TaxID=10212 RepID=A0A7J7JVB8_BUGNE|nr:hypothetical protein EB796_012405 [Bugula neritina]
MSVCVGSCCQVTLLYSYAYACLAVKPSRTLLVSSDDEKSCGNEPWPVFLARKSLQGIVNYISPQQIDDNGGVWANTSEMPLVVTTSPHKGSLHA